MGRSHDPGDEREAGGKIVSQIAGIALMVDPLMPKDEFWIIRTGRSETFRVHEGPQAGEDLTVWLSKPWIVKVFNLGV